MRSGPNKIEKPVVLPSKEVDESQSQEETRRSAPMHSTIPNPLPRLSGIWACGVAPPKLGTC